MIQNRNDNKKNRKKQFIKKQEEKKFIEGIAIIGKQERDTRAQSRNGRRIWWDSRKKCGIEKNRLQN